MIRSTPICDEGKQADAERHDDRPTGAARFQNQSRRQRENQIGGPFGADRPGRKIPPNRRGRAPGMDHQEVGGQVGKLKGVRIGLSDAQDRGRREEDQHRAEGGEVHGVNPGKPVFQKAAIGEAPLADLGQVNVRQDEAGEGEKEIDA
jgi:hypothetical protein